MRALVTGSMADIGFAAAKQLAGEGALVYANEWSEGRVLEAAEKIGANAKGGAADLGLGSEAASAPPAQVRVSTVGP